MCMGEYSPCTSFRQTPVVFVGRVTSVEESRVQIKRFGEMQSRRTGLLAHFAVEEPLKGINQKTVDVVTGGGGGDCGYIFREGETYLVYAYKTESESGSSTIAQTIIGGRSNMTASLTTSICSRTRLLKNADDDVELLRALKAGKPQTRIFGRVVEYAQAPHTYSSSPAYKGPMAGVRITAQNAKRQHKAVTAADGYYRIRGAPPGKYTVTIFWPEGYGPVYSSGRSQAKIELTAEACGVEVNFETQVDGRIGGRVFDVNGKPARQLQVSLVTLESSAKGMSLVEGFSDFTEEDGSYLFDGLQPGKYLVGISITDPPDSHTPYATLYYPQSSDRTQARVFDLSFGQKVKDIDFRLPSKLPEVTVSGVVVDSVGRAVAEANVYVYDEEDLTRMLWFSQNLKTDKQGQFTFRCFKGRRYRLHAWKAQDYLAGTGQQSELIPIDTNAPLQPVTLTLNKSGIFRPRHRDHGED